MKPYFLDLTLEISEGSLHNLGDIVLLCRLTASNRLPNGEERKGLIVERSWAWKPTTREICPNKAAIKGLLDRLAALGLPHRQPQLEAVNPIPHGWERIALSVTLNEASQTTVFLKNGGSYGGKDGPAFGALISQILQTLEEPTPEK